VRKSWLLLAGLALAISLSAAGAAAQTAGRPRRIGFLGSRARPEPLESDPYSEVPKTLRELGYVEGRDFVMEWRFAAGDYGRLPSLAQELAALPVDVIVADGTPGTRAAQAATKSIPILFVGGADVVGDGLVKSLSHPGGNTTGCSMLLADTAAKQFELLHTWVPKVRNVAVLYNPGNPAHEALLKRVIDAAEARQIHAVPLGARTPAEIEKAFPLAVEERSEALIWLTDSFLFQQARQTAELSIRNRLPSVSGYPEYAERGGLMGYGPNRRDLYRRLAGYVDQVLKGANPGDLPVQQPTTLDLYVNRKTARDLGLAIPPEVLVLANKVID